MSDTGLDARTQHSGYINVPSVDPVKWEYDNRGVKREVDTEDRSLHLDGYDGVWGQVVWVVTLNQVYSPKPQSPPRALCPIKTP